MSQFITRGKRTDNDEWVYGFYACLNDDKGNTSHRIYTGYAESDCGDFYPEWFEVVPESVGKHTGLRDKCEDRIFEGDILDAGTELYREKYGFPKVGIGEFYDPEYDYLGYGVFITTKEGQASIAQEHAGNYKIIGNIHDGAGYMEG